MFCYLLRNRVNCKRYIGITRGTVEQRWIVHCKKARLGSKLYIHTAIRKYGPENFELFVIKQFTDINEMFDFEAAQVAKLKPEYNLTAGGKGVRAYSDELKLRMKASAQARFQRIDEQLKAKQRGVVRQQQTALRKKLQQEQQYVMAGSIAATSRDILQHTFELLSLNKLLKLVRLPRYSSETIAKMRASAKARMQTAEGQASILKAVAARCAH